MGESLSEDARPALKTLARGALLRCPVCGLGRVFQAPFRVRPRCAACGALFQREEGFFVGALMINVVTTEAAVLAAAGLCLLLVDDAGGTLLLSTLFAVALLFPVAFYHHAWSLWLAADHLFERLPEQ